jgi:type I restriction enzyme M protein
MRHGELVKGENATDLLVEQTRLHNYLYANEGLSKEAIFRDISKVIAIRLYAERKGHNPFNASASAIDKLSSLRAVGVELGQVFQLPDFASFALSDRALMVVLETLSRFKLLELSTDFLSDTYHTFFAHYHRGARGEFHTPYPVVKLAVRLANPKPSESVIDPAAGAGSFLVGAARFVSATQGRESDSDWSVEEYVRNRLWAVEINPDMDLFLRVRFFIEHGVEPRTVNGNGLVFALENEENFDIVITNPPFGAKGKVDDPFILERYELAKEWKRVEGGWIVSGRESPKPRPPEILFLEASIRLLKPGGRLVVVVPDGILQNAQAEYVRFWLRQRARLLAVISLPSTTFVPYGTGVKTSLVVLERKSSWEATRPLQKVFFAVSSNVGYDRKGRTLPGSDLEEIVQAFEALAEGGVRRDLAEIGHEEVGFLVEESAVGERWDAEHHFPRRPRRDREEASATHTFSVRNADTGALFVRKLGEVAVFKEVKLSKKGLSPDALVRYIEISSALPGIPLIGRTELIPAKDLPSRATYMVKTGNILLAIAGASTGTEKQTIALVTEEHDGAVCTNGFAVLTPLPEKVNPFFLLGYLYSDAFLGELRRLLKGHAIPAASLADVRNIPVYLPPRPVQDLIGEEMRKALEDLRKGLGRLKTTKEKANIS